MFNPIKLLIVGLLGLSATAMAFPTEAATAEIAQVADAADNRPYNYNNNDEHRREEERRRHEQEEREREHRREEERRREQEERRRREEEERRHHNNGYGNGHGDRHDGKGRGY